MSLDNIQLSHHLAHLLYKNSLVHLDPGKQAAEILQKKPFKYLGKNEKNILIIISENEQAWLPEEHLNILIKMLAALHFTLEDVAIVNMHTEPGFNYNKGIEALQPGTIILFGVEPARAGFPLHFPRYQVQRYNNMSFLHAASFTDLENDVDEKKILWASLQQMFKPA